jgi:hypothetical protein
MRAGHELIVRHDFIDESDAQRLLRTDDLAGVEQLVGRAEPDEPRQALRATAPR